MVRRFLPRISLFRTLAPRPILPIARLTVVKPVAPRSRLFSHFSARQNSLPPSPLHEHGPELPPNASLTQRLKHLIKSYGWYALGVYTILSVLDFSVAFAGVNLLGAEHVARVAASVKEMVSGLIHSLPPEPGHEEVERASSHHSGQEGLYAMLVLAYTIHKTLFLPVRVGLTAAVTPKLVKWLRTRGWAGSDGTRRAAQEMRERLRNGRNRD